ncbi:MAG: tetratricopeptide repeat protein [Planctomycetota bacterium]
MARFLVGALVLVAVAIATFGVWMRSDAGGVVELSDAEVESARASGVGAREIAVEASGEADPLPTIDDLEAIARRVDADAIAARIREAREAASGEDRELLTVLLAEAERIRGNVDVAYDLARAGAEALPSNSRARYVLSQSIMTRLIAKAEEGGVAAMLASIDDVRAYQAELAAAVELDPANVDARVRQIITFAFGPWPIGNKKKARALIDELGEYDAFKRDFWLVQLLVADESKIDAAIAGFRALDERQPDDEHVLYNLGELLAKKDDHRAAAEAFDRMVVEPRTSRAYQALYQGAKAREKGDFELDRALEMLEEVESADPVGDLMPTRDRVLYHKGKVLAKLGRNDEARVAYEAALEVRPGNERVESALAKLDGDGADG